MSRSRTFGIASSIWCSLSEEEFQALRRWIDARCYLLALIHKTPADLPFVRARLRELEEADQEAREVLVEPPEEDLIG